MGAVSQLYLDVVGSLDRGLPAAYAGVAANGCPRCGAAPFDACINPATGRRAAHPCLVRLNVS